MNDPDPGGARQEASDPVSAAAYRRAAQTHAEAAKLHHAAVEVQANHAREHEG
jgi:hypothetical protein